MFTGIIEETGVVRQVTSSKTGIRLVIAARRTARRLAKGDSVAVNGCCLTTVSLATRGAEKWMGFDLLEETWRRTNLQFVQPGSAVNLERPLRLGATLDGHFVTGHVDGMGKILDWRQQGKDWFLEVAPPARLISYIIEKGSVAVDGISLTVAELRKKSFVIWIIPHTCKVTALRERQPGDQVNLEADLLGKYVERFIQPYLARTREKGRFASG
jgi:riboflavin synthase